MSTVENGVELLRRCYAAAIAAAQPAAALQGPLRAMGHDRSPCWLIAVGKAAPGMAAAVIAWLAEDGRRLAGGVVVGSESAADVADHPRAGSSPPGLRFITGDHPIPREASASAADAVGDLVRRIPAGAEVHVALSGGASALIAGPLTRLTMADVTATFGVLLTSGLDIHEMNAVRKRITRWSAGRLALALAGRRVRVWVISDVPGDDLGSIASGPCTGDPWFSDDVLRLLAESRLLERLSAPVRVSLAQETPKPGDAGLAGITPQIIANNRTALAAAAEMSQRCGVVARVISDPLVGDAATMGRRIATTMHQHTGSAPELLLWGGETTVAVPDGSGTGGRSQELALAAAQALHEAEADGLLLAAGTDGRDGPTDAAGAIVDRSTWRRILAAGRDPAGDLARHDCYPALDAVSALVRTGLTGTNVMDLAIAVTGARWSAP